MSDDSPAPPPDATVLTLDGQPRTGVASAAVPSEHFAGRYALEALIGQGGMGRVYRARDVLVGDVVALKTLELGKDPGTDAVERFRREVRLARRISHPNVARMHDLGEHAGQHYLTMEYVDGVDLRTLIAREGPLAPSRATRIALAVCEGLAAAHAAGVMHRDLKPANVLVEKGGRVVLTDFGIARALVDEAAQRTQGTAGTPMYMAPEQLSGGELGPRADLYAVGLMLYEMLTAAMPFSGDSPIAVAFARLRQPPPDPRAKLAVPDGLAELVLRCLAREPEQRPEGASQLALALRAWVDTSPAPLTSPPSLTSLPAVPEAPTLVRGVSSTLSTLTSVQGVAVLPLRFQGPQDQAHLGEGLGETLIDVLSRTRGVRVTGSGATARFRTEREPRAVGRELGVAYLVDGMVQSAGPLVRVSVRLVETAEGTQLWSDRFEDSSADPFTLQNRLGQRIAEALRVELRIGLHRDTTSPDALSLFRQAFVRGYTPGYATDTALEWVEQCLQLAPELSPAMALHALLSLRAWFVGTSGQPRDWEQMARASVARLEQKAPHLAETHLARAMLAGQESDWRKAVLAVRAALEAAPTFPSAMQFLGSLQCEAGRADEGLTLLRRAFELDSRLGLSLFELARCSALRGNMDDYRQAMDKLATFNPYRIPALMLRLRVSAWNGDLDAVRECGRALQDENVPIGGNGARYAAVVLGELEPRASIEQLDAVLARSLSPRFGSLMRQLAAEQLCLTGHPEKALEYFLRAAETALIDLEWTDRCPALASMRSLPGFTEGRRLVRARVQAIWNG
ncbi:protein kinase domain-containing protein [Archangium sp.]|uniref:protein kinase domain-containing protein n=1 Tax=Archangium sp. TaxID=1872627 RepID=UPI00286A0E2F|nr:protein kinase [Archangium sp.]